MKISAKVGLIVTLLMMPLLMLAYAFVAQSNKEISFATREKLGSAYLRSVWPILSSLADRAVFDNVVISTTTLAEGAATHAGDLNVASSTAELLKAIAGIAPGHKGISPDVEAAFDAATRLITEIGNESNLILDPDLDSFYAMDAVVVKLPQVLGQTAELFDHTNELAGTITDSTKQNIALHAGQLKAAVDGTRDSLNYLFTHDSGHDQKAALSAEFDAFSAAAQAYMDEASKLQAALSGDPAGVQAEVEPLAAARQSLIVATNALWKKTTDQLDVILTARISQLNSTLWTMLAIAGLVTLLALALSVWLGHSITKAVNCSIREMLALADGDLETDISGRERKDEFGQIAKALLVFKEHAIERLQLETMQRSQEEQALAQKRAAALAIAEQFRASVGQIVEQVGTNASELEAAAGVMSGSAEETTTQAVAVSSASEEASSSVQTVASATEELTYSVHQISEQVGLSATKASQAVTAANETVAKVRSLSEASQKIGAIVGLIQEIAAQTNLLALNATIEAARAGDAGKGFAVVASEVKGLAAQTAKATTEISQQIAGIQAATSDSAGAISSIAGAIGELNDIASAIASGVAQQAAATQEIALSIQNASKGTSAVSSNISGVSVAAEQSSQVATQVRLSSSTLKAASQKLTSEVEGFLTSLTAA